MIILLSSVLTIAFVIPRPTDSSTLAYNLTSSETRTILPIKMKLLNGTWTQPVKYNFDTGASSATDMAPEFLSAFGFGPDGVGSDSSMRKEQPGKIRIQGLDGEFDLPIMVQDKSHYDLFREEPSPTRYPLLRVKDILTQVSMVFTSTQTILRLKWARRRSYPYRMTDKNDDDDYDGMQEHHASSSSSSSHRYRILSLIETFIDQIFRIRKTLLGVSISAVIMAPIAIGLSVYLLRYPSFLAILDIENDFGSVLAVLLGAIIIQGEFRIFSMAQAQGNLTSSLIPEQKAAICAPCDIHVNVTESKICGIPITSSSYLNMMRLKCCICGVLCQ